MFPSEGLNEIDHQEKKKKDTRDQLKSSWSSNHKSLVILSGEITFKIYSLLKESQTRCFDSKQKAEDVQSALKAV